MDRAGKIVLKGELATLLAGATLTQSPEQIEDSLFRQLSTAPAVKNKKIKLPDLKSRIVKDIDFDFSLTEENQELSTNAGMGLPLDEANLFSYIQVQDDQVADLYVGHPRSFKKRVLIKGMQAVNLKALDFELKTPWLEATRTARQTPEGIELLVTVMLLKRSVANADLNKAPYQKLIADINKHFKNIAVIVTPLGGK